MSAAHISARLLTALEQDSGARLRWRVMERLGICPISLRALLLTRRAAVRCACHLALSRAAVQPDAADANPAFDPARFEALRARR
ncbi:MAG: hypothetical protein LUF68_06550 [Clostridiales bacterium]|nr:hypothetical protein [Oscillospiraceae bacterium]MCD8008580.1 hypothetical protein [Clostridiales bacterium]